MQNMARLLSDNNRGRFTSDQGMANVQADKSTFGWYLHTQHGYSSVLSKPVKSRINLSPIYLLNGAIRQVIEGFCDFWFRTYSVVDGVFGLVIGRLVDLRWA